MPSPAFQVWGKVTFTISEAGAWKPRWKFHPSFSGITSTANTHVDNIPKENKNKMMNLFIFDKVLEG